MTDAALNALRAFVVIGHVDTGKSTLCGQLLWSSLSEDDKRRAGTPARVLDIYEEERVRGKTHEYDTRTFAHNNVTYRLIDTPGHAQFIRSMIAGMSAHLSNSVGDDCQASVAVVIISAIEGEFAASFNKQNSTLKEQLILARAFGIERVILAINKMDAVVDDAAWRSSAVYIARRDSVAEFCAKLGWPRNSISAVAISAKNALNIFTRCCVDNPTLMEALNTAFESLTADGDATPRRAVTRFTAEISVIGRGVVVSAGYGATAHICGMEAEATIQKIKAATFVKYGGRAVCVIALSIPVTARIGDRFVLRTGAGTSAYGTVACGVIRRILSP